MEVRYVKVHKHTHCHWSGDNPCRSLPNSSAFTMLKEDLARMNGLGVYGLRRWNREWLSLGVRLTQDRQAWAAAIRDVVALDTGTTSPSWTSSQVSKVPHFQRRTAARISPPAVSLLLLHQWQAEPLFWINNGERVRRCFCKSLSRRQHEADHPHSPYCEPKAEIPSATVHVKMSL